MASWPTGRDAVNELIREGRIDRVTGDLADVDLLLAAASKHLVSAETLADSDPIGAYCLLYDAVRKSLTALLLAQGLRPTSKGGHYAVELVINAQFTKPPPSAAFKSFGRMRTTRHEGEYGAVAAIDTDLVRDDLPRASKMQQVAVLLVPSLGAFTG